MNQSALINCSNMSAVLPGTAAKCGTGVSSLLLFCFDLCTPMSPAACSFACTALLGTRVVVNGTAAGMSCHTDPPVGSNRQHGTSIHPVFSPLPRLMLLESACPALPVLDAERD